MVVREQSIYDDYMLLSRVAQSLELYKLSLHILPQCEGEAERLQQMHLYTKKSL